MGSVFEVSTQIGFIDSDGHPRIRVRITGTVPGVSVDLDALIDTGFTGFLMLPVAQALSLGLVLIGTGDYTLADGSAVTNFLVKGTLTIGPDLYFASAGNPDEAPESPKRGSESAEGVIVLSGDEALIGMDFLRTLNKALLIHSTSVTLTDEDAPNS